MRYEKSANALNVVLVEKYYLCRTTLVHLDDEKVLSRPGALYAYVQGLMHYLEERRKAAIAKADTDTARRIEKVYRKAVLAFFDLGHLYNK